MTSHAKTGKLNIIGNEMEDITATIGDFEGTQKVLLSIQTAKGTFRYWLHHQNAYHSLTEMAEALQNTLARAKDDCSKVVVTPGDRSYLFFQIQDQPIKQYTGGMR